MVTLHSHTPGFGRIQTCTECDCDGYSSHSSTHKTNSKMLISPLLFEVKIRYISAFLFLVFTLMFYFSYNFLDLNLFTDELGFATFAYGYCVFIPLFLWSLFNRWYFMVPAMLTLSVLTFFTIVLAIAHSHFIEAQEWIIPIALFTEGLGLSSFVMYVHRLKIQKKHSIG